MRKSVDGVIAKEGERGRYRERERERKREGERELREREWRKAAILRFVAAP